MDKVDLRKEKLKYWLKDYKNLLLILIFLFAIIIRLYYFTLTKNQPLWWDEAAYGTLAKNYIYHTWDGTSIILGETAIRPPLFPIIWSLLIRLGIGEAGVRFLLEFFPSLLSILAVYLIAKEVYGKNTALISTTTISVLWIHLFYTSRLLTHLPEMPLIFFSIYLLIKISKSKFNPKLFAISLILLSLATLMRYTAGILFFAYLIFILLIFRIKIIGKTSFWYSGIIGISPILIFFLVNYLNYRNIFPALLGGDYIQEVSKSINWGVLGFIPGYLQTAFLIFFLIGTFFILFELVLEYDLIREREKTKGSFLLLLVFLFIYGYFIFYLKGAEDRWLLPASVSLVIFTGVGLNKMYEFIKKYNKITSLIVLFAIIIFGVYSQVKFGDELIKNRAQSFLQMRQGFEWIKENTPEDTVIIGQGIEVYSVYYAERRYKDIPETPEELNNEAEAGLLVVHAFTPQRDYLQDYLSNQNKWIPINAFFFDKEQTQAAFIIYARAN